MRRYQEMHQTFLSAGTLYILVWNVALPKPEDEDAATMEMEEQLASWATLIQTCAPGATVQLVVRAAVSPFHHVAHSQL